MEILAGRRGLVAGIANNRSLATAIARAARAAGAEVALTYQNERFRSAAVDIGTEIGTALVLPCDVARDEDITTVADTLGQRWDRLDFFVHAIAFAKREELTSGFLDTSREGFAVALDASVYSLIGMTRALAPLLAKSGDSASVLTLTYLGSERVVPSYNVMGVAKAALEATVRYLACDLGPRHIRVNALSPGPVRTLSAAGVPGLRDMLSLVERTAPLQRNITPEEVGNAAAFLLSPLSSGLTGEVIHLDAGFSTMAVTPTRSNET